MWVNPSQPPSVRVKERKDFVLPSKILFCEGGLGTDWDWDWDWVWDWDWEGLKMRTGILFVVRRRAGTCHTGYVRSVTASLKQRAPGAC